MDSHIIQRVLDLTVAIQQIPAPTFDESQRSNFIRHQFELDGLSDITIDEIGNVYARLPGAGSALPLIISAHLDTVFPSGINLEVQLHENRIQGPGIGDNALGVAGLFGLLWGLRQKWGKDRFIPGDIWLVANVCEEGLGDLRGMRAVVDRFGSQVCAYLVLEGMALGQIYHRGLGVKRYRISLFTQGGHSWVDYGAPSAIHEMAALITRLTSLSIPDAPRSSLNVGVISGGTSVNTIAPEAHIELDLRSIDEQVLNNMSKRVEAVVESSNRSEVQTTCDVIGKRPAGEIPSTHPLVQLTQRCLVAQGVTPTLAIGSTDANIPLSLGIPAVCLGLSTGYGAHTIREYINTPPLEGDLAQLMALIENVYQELM